MKLFEGKANFADAMLMGLGQIMLQENSLTGLLFLVGIFYGGAWMGVAAILAVFCGTLTAKVLGYDKEEIQKGLDGFSAGLVGVALALYFQPVFLVWMAIILGSTLATMIQHWFIVKKLPVFTLPFVLVTWLMIYLIHELYPSAIPVPPDPKLPIAGDFAVALRGFGQVIFQSSPIAGLIFIIAVFANAPVQALYGIGAAVLGAALAFQCSAPVESIDMGLFSYNAVLCAIALAGQKPKDGIWVLMAVVLSVLISLFMVRHNLIELTFPFVVATVITLVLKKYLLSFFNKLGMPSR